MKIGILTYHHVTNYGSLLQAYALWQALKQQGYDVELIDYRPYKAVKFYLQALYPLKQGKKRPYFNRQFLANIVKSWKMRRFLLSQMQLSKRKCYTQSGLKQYHQQYDVVISGSDQIWDINAVIRGCDLSYFLDFVCDPNTRKISYAASFGSTTTLGENQQEISQLIHKFETILVRDWNSLQLLNKEVGIQATKVLDPTLLVEYDHLTSIPKLDKNYLLVYFQGHIPLEQEKLIKAIAKANNLEIISIGYHHPVAQRNLIGIGIEEWLGYFAQASYVVTDTFHGTIFSIIFKKRFNVFVNKDKSLKVMDLLIDLGLESRAVIDATEDSFAGEDFSDINYSLAYEKLDEKILLSKAYLSEALTSRHQFSEVQMASK